MVDSSPSFFFSFFFIIVRCLEVSGGPEFCFVFLV